MAFNELEERISKIRQQNEVIKRRYEEVEEDKKNAAKLNALVQMVPSTDWPERKEPPEYSNPPKVIHKQKSVSKEQSDQLQQHYPNDRKKGEGPPPDPKYNFLADAEREEHVVPNTRDNAGNKSHNRSIRGNFKKRGTGREGQERGRIYHGTQRDEHKPEYEAWRKERNRIDEDRISRQKTAEGNWRREWDNDKAYAATEISKGEGKATLGDFTKRDHKDARHSDGNGYASHNRGAYKSYRSSSRNFHNNHDYHHMNSYDQHSHDMSSMNSTSASIDERTVIATDKSIKVMLNQNPATKGPVMSVKVNSPSIAGTGRVGPRQRTRVTYSSQSDVEANAYKTGSFSRQKSFEDKSKGSQFNNTQKNPSLRRPQSQKKKENDDKSPYSQRKEYRKENSSVNSAKYYENGSQQSFVRKDYKVFRKFHNPSKSPRASHKKMKTSGVASQSGDPTNEECSELKNEKTVLECNTSVELQNENGESSNREVKIDKSSIIVEEQSKTDLEKNNDITLKSSESSVEQNLETSSANIKDTNNDANFSSTSNQDNVSIIEDNKKSDEETKEGNSESSYCIQDIDKDIEKSNNEKNKINDSTLSADNLHINLCTFDNNKSITNVATRVEDVKTELVKKDLSSTVHVEDDKTALVHEDQNIAVHVDDAKTELVQKDLSSTTHVEDVKAELVHKDVSSTACAGDVQTELFYEDVSNTASVEDIKIELSQKDISSMSNGKLLKEASNQVNDKDNIAITTTEELSTDTCVLVKDELLNKTSVVDKEDSSTSTCTDVKEKICTSTCVLVQDDATCHDNKVLIDENVLPVDETRDKSTIKTSEDSPAKCIDDISEYSTSNKAGDLKEVVDVVVENAKMQTKNDEYITEEKKDKIESTDANSESKEN